MGDEARRPIDRALAEAMSSERLRILAGLIRRTGDWELAEDALHDAAERALATWPAAGIPANPAAWLTTTATRRALDVLRRRQTEVRTLSQVAEFADREPAPIDMGSGYADDRLRLLVTCCHPALPLAGRVALTLKFVSGLTTKQIARAFMVSEATMSQRLLRTKQKIADQGIEFSVPAPHEIDERLGAVLTVLSVVFTEGYAPTDGRGPNRELADEAIALAGLLTRLLPADDEGHALLALMLLQHARFEARVDAAGDVVPLEEQDRGLWDRAAITEGLAALTTARQSGAPPGPFRAQAEIAAIHSTSLSPAATDWRGIVAWYDALLAAAYVPIVALNRAMAIGMSDGPRAGLDALAAVVDGGGLDGNPHLPAVRADLLRRGGMDRDALVAYRDAAAVARTDAERRHFERRIAELTS